MRPGDPFSYDALENAINDLRKWGVFRQVEVLVERRPNRTVHLTFQLEDAYLIKDVEIHGNFPLLEKKIRRAIFLSSGEIFDPERIPEQIERLLSFYEKEGYRDTSVLIEKQFDEPHRKVILKIQIEKGKKYSVGEVQVVGNQAIESGKIKRKIRRFFNYSPNRLKKDFERITKLYHKKGYLKARVRLAKIDFDEEKRRANLTLEIREGKKVEVLFEGNKRQMTRKLKSKVSILETGDTDDFELDYSKSQLFDHYKSLGFEGTQVDAQREKVTDRFTRVKFNIQEGKKLTLKSIDFEGNESFSDRRLKKLMQTQQQGLFGGGIYVEDVFKQDLETIESFYKENGFFEAKIQEWSRSLNPTEDKYLLDVKLREGEQSTVFQVSFEGLKRFTPREIEKFLLLKADSPYSLPRLEEDVRAILAYYSNHGYPYADVKTDIEEKTDREVAIHYRITEGPLVKVGRVLFVGNDKTRPQSLQQALRFKEGDVFNPQQILESQTTLRKLGIFDSLSIETLGLKAKEKAIHVVVRVEEKKDKILDVGLSYDTDTSFKAKFYFTYLNLFGRAKNLDVRATGGVQFNRLELLYTDPRFLGSDWQFLANAYGQYERRPFFEDLQAGGSAGFFRELNRRLSLLMKYELIHTKFNKARTDFSLLRPGTADNTTGKLQFSVTYDRRDNFGDPRSGIYTYGRTDYGTEFKPDVLHFLKMAGRFGHWWSPIPRFTIANALRLNAIIPFAGQGEIPTQELIFLGGDDTVRGFKEDAINPAGGKFSFVHNLELQMRLFKGFQMVGFLDSGFLTNRINEINLSTLRHSGGVGLRYATPVGPLRLDYGVILDRRPEENRSRLHFTFGYFF